MGHMNVRYECKVSWNFYSDRNGQIGVARTYLSQSYVPLTWLNIRSSRLFDDDG